MVQLPPKLVSIYSSLCIDHKLQKCHSERKEMYVNTKTCTIVFLAALHSCQTLETTPMPFNRWMAKQTGTSSQWNAIQQWKGQNYWYMQQLGWILKSLCSVNGTSVKSLYSVWFHLNDILERDCWGKENNCQNGSTREPLVVKGLVCILMMVLVKQTYLCVKSHRPVHQKRKK